MPRESTQHKLDRVRSPRVHITYDVEVGDAIEMKELPFVMGVLGDLSGQPKQPLAAFKERKFVEITPDNFDAVLKGMAPQLAFSVANKLSDEPDAGQLSVELNFEGMDDFSPERVAAAGEAAQGAAGSAHATCPTCAAACRATTSSTTCSSRRFRTRRRGRSCAPNSVKTGVRSEHIESSRSAGRTGDGTGRRGRFAARSDCCAGKIQPRRGDARTRARPGEGVCRAGAQRPDDALAGRGGIDPGAHSADRPAYFAAGE